MESTEFSCGKDKKFFSHTEQFAKLFVYPYRNARDDDLC